jgi:hypothetical protein
MLGLWGVFAKASRQRQQVLIPGWPRLALFGKKPMSQNYQPGQLVRLLRAGLSKRDASASDLYEVIRLMPADRSGEVAYRIKSESAGERAVRGGEITAHISD